MRAAVLTETGRIDVRRVFAPADFFSVEPALSVRKLAGCYPGRAVRDLHFPSGGQWPRKLTHPGRPDALLVCLTVVLTVTFSVSRMFLSRWM